MAATMMGAVSDVYRGRFEAMYDQLDYTSGEKIVYPDVINTEWLWYQPLGPGTYSGSDSTTSNATNKVVFEINNSMLTDPHSWRIWFQCFVTSSSSSAALCNYAHSIFQQVTIAFTGSSSGLVEQVSYYNVFCSMLYKFYSANHARYIQQNLEGFTPLTAYIPIMTVASSATPITQLVGPYPDITSVFAAANKRIWNGRSFALPLNVGFLMTARKLVPHLILPNIRIEILMETVARATMATASGTPKSSPNYYINAVQLVMNKYNVQFSYIDALRAKVIEDQDKDDPIRLDYDSWIAFPSTIAANSGTVRLVVSKDLSGLRKLMFAQVPQIAGTSSTTNLFNTSDAINTFVTNTLLSYRWIINNKYYPDIPIPVTGTSDDGSLTGEKADSSLAYFFNTYAVGVSDNPSADINQQWAQSGQTVSACQDIVLMTATEFDDASLSSMYNMVRTGQVDLVLNFGTSVVAADIYIFANCQRNVVILDGARAIIYDG